MLQELHRVGGINKPRRPEKIWIDWAYDYLVDGALDTIVEGDSQMLREREKLRNLVMVVFWCIQEAASLGPTIKKVIQMMEGAVVVSSPP